MKVWVLEQFGHNGFRTVVHVFGSEQGVIKYMEPYGKVSLARGVNNGLKEMIFKLADFPSTSYRATQFEVKE